MENNEVQDDLDLENQDDIEFKDLFPEEEEAQKKDEEEMVTIPKNKLKTILIQKKKLSDFKKETLAGGEKPPKKEVKTNTDTTNEYLTKEEAVLIAQGMKLEDLEQVKLIQKGMGSTLKEAYDSPLFQTYIKQQAEEERKKKAALPASNGGSGKQYEGFSKPGMTEEEHRKLWAEHQK